MIIAIDGPSGSGKSSVSRAVASALGARYLDTGSMYRAVTWSALRDGVDIADPEAIAAHASTIDIDPSTDPLVPGIRVDGEDISDAIRQPDVTASVSAVSAVPEVRSLLVDLQRRIASSGDIVVEGRDIGPVVLPHADLKVFLTADPLARALRRAAQEGGSAAAAQDALERRDTADSTRAVSPLEQASDAVEVDSTHLDLDEVVARIMELAADRA